MSFRAGPLGRIEPSDQAHIERYPITPATMPGTPTPVVAGIPWYETFDTPFRDRNGVYWICDPSRLALLGRIRGGHAIAIKAPFLNDTPGWQAYYDQGDIPASPAYSLCRAMSMLNRTRYAPLPLHERTMQVDGWPDERDGTTIRAAFDVARDDGLWLTDKGVDHDLPTRSEGVRENRWATDVETLVACLSPRDAGALMLAQDFVVAVNSWGKGGYPGSFNVPLDLIHRFMQEGGEFAVVVERR